MQVRDRLDCRFCGNDSNWTGTVGFARRRGKRHRPGHRGGRLRKTMKNDTNEASMFLKIKDYIGKRTQNEPNFERQMRGLDTKSGFLGISPNPVIPTLSAAKGRNLALALFSAKHPCRAGFLVLRPKAFGRRVAPLGMREQKETQNRGNEAKKSLKIKDVTFCRVQKRTQNEPGIACQIPDWTPEVSLAGGDVRQRTGRPASRCTLPAALVREHILGAVGVAREDLGGFERVGEAVGGRARQAIVREREAGGVQHQRHVQTGQCLFEFFLVGKIQSRPDHRHAMHATRAQQALPEHVRQVLVNQKVRPEVGIEGNAAVLKKLEAPGSPHLPCAPSRPNPRR